MKRSELVDTLAGRTSGHFMTREWRGKHLDDGVKGRKPARSSAPLKQETFDHGIHWQAHGGLVRVRIPKPHANDTKLRAWFGRAAMRTQGKLQGAHPRFYAGGETLHVEQARGDAREFRAYQVPADRPFPQVVDRKRWAGRVVVDRNQIRVEIRDHWFLEQTAKWLLDHVLNGRATPPAPPESGLRLVE